jgi:hypothetical protein
MDRRLVLGIGPFALLLAASCGSSSGGSNSNPEHGGDDASLGGSDASSSSSSSGEMAGGDGSPTSSGVGGPDGSASSSGSGSSSGSSGGADASSGGGGTSMGAAADVAQMHKHINRDGLFVDSAFTEAKLMGATLHIDKTFAGTFSGNMYASPIYVSDGVNHKGTFYIVTESDSVYALDEATGSNAIPMKSAGTAATRTGAGCGNISPIGITGTPAIDQASRLIVFDAATADSSGGIKTHTIHAWSIDTFAEAWSLDVSTLKDPTAGSFMPQPQNERSAVLIANGIAYVAYGGHYGDCGPYHGWLVGVPLSATSATVGGLAKEYATPASEAGMWAPGGPSSDGTDIFMATGNGTTDSPASMANWKGSFSILRFAAGPVFTPGASNFWHATADDSMIDKDLGGSAPLVVDDPAITPSKLLVQLGKDGFAYTVNRTNMGGEVSPVGAKQVMNGEISNSAAWATTPKGTFVAMVSNGGGGGTGCMKGSGNLAVISLSATAQISVPWCANNQGNGSPSITSSDGTNDTMVWTVGAEASNQLHAWDLATGTQVVTGSDAMASVRHFTTPIFVNGRVFAAGDGRLYAFTVP